MLVTAVTLLNGFARCICVAVAADVVAAIVAVADEVGVVVLKLTFHCQFFDMNGLRQPYRDMKKQ